MFSWVSLGSLIYRIKKKKLDPKMAIRGPNNCCPQPTMSREERHFIISFLYLKKVFPNALPTGLPL